MSWCPWASRSWYVGSRRYVVFLIVFHRRGPSGMSLRSHMQPEPAATSSTPSSTSFSQVGIDRLEKVAKQLDKGP